jgi:hypothetical protein
MNELHPIEAAWRQFRSSRHVSLLHESIRAVPKLLPGLEVTRLPNEVTLPVAAPLAICMLLHDRLRAQYQHQLVLRFGCEILANTIQVWAGYRECKLIYQVETSLADCLGQTPWPDEPPVEVLHLAARCVILELPWQGTRTYVAALYDLSVPDPSIPSARAGILNVRLSNFVPCGLTRVDDPPLVNELKGYWVPLCTLSLDAGPLGEAVQQANRAAPIYGSVHFVLAHGNFGQNPLSALALTILLYLAGEPDIVRIAHSGEKPLIKPAVKKRDPERYKDLREPMIHAVGKSFTRAIERWEIEHPRERGDPAGRTVRPHTRRAHAHLYWTGEGRQTPRVRFLLPISVKGGKLVEEPESPRMTAVR